MKNNNNSAQIVDVGYQPSPKTFPPHIERRVKALRDQFDAMNGLQEEYKRERFALEARFIKKRDEYCNRRRLILSGEQDVPVPEGSAGQSFQIHCEL